MSDEDESSNVRLRNFYLSSWQKSDCPVPLFIIRIILLLSIIGVVTFSKYDSLKGGWYSFWFIYLTHWGLIVILITAMFAVLTSAIAVIKKEMDDDYLPIYAIIFWVLYNIANPAAYCITIFFWSVLYRGKHFTLMFATHSVNSIIMFLMMCTSAIPSRIWHFYQPLIFGICWTIFSFIYYHTGGVNERGKPYVYHVINWAMPFKTLLIILATILLLVALHMLVVLLARLRDKLAFLVKNNK